MRDRITVEAHKLVSALPGGQMDAMAIVIEAIAVGYTLRRKRK